MKTVFGSTCVLAVICGFQGIGFGQSFLTNGLVAYYPFNGNANDASGNGNDGTVQNAVLVADRFGTPNAAYRFNGSNSGILFPEAILGPAVSGFTVSAWVTTDPGVYSDAEVIVEKSSKNGEFKLMIQSGEIVFGPKLQNPVEGILASAPAPTNATSHLVGVYRRGQQAELYINGVLMNAAPLPDSDLWVDTSGYPLDSAIGIYDYVPGPYLAFHGVIDDVRFYNRDLATNEVQQLYAFEAGLLCPRPAMATATVVNGFVIAATLMDGGCGYTNTPLVVIDGGGGSGATAVAIVTNGVVQEIRITDAGFGYTNPPTILVGSAPVIAAEPQSVTAALHQSASFNVSLAAPTPVAYQWSFNGTNLAGATRSSLTITNVTQSVLGLYSVLLTNVFGATNSSAAVLSMYPYLAASFGGVLAYWGQDTSLSVQAGGSGPLTYQWYQNGLPLPGGTNSALLLSSIQFTNAGTYWIVVSNPFGSVTNVPAQVVVNPAGISLGLYPGITVSGTIGYNYVIQRTADLNDTNSWLTLTNLTLTQPVQLWVDTNTDASLPPNPVRFYRVLPGQ